MKRNWDNNDNYYIKGILNYIKLVWIWQEYELY